jgi:bifunctional non-homologous end joining protein LigD
MGSAAETAGHSSSSPQLASRASKPATPAAGKAYRGSARSRAKIPRGALRRPLNPPHPALATLAPTVPSGADWIHEIKFDGYRIVATLDRGKVVLHSRNGKDWTHRFPEIAEQLAALPADQAVLDGEVVALERGGASSFRRLQAALSAKQSRGLVYQLFDLLYLDGYDLKNVPLLERKDLLCELVGGLPHSRDTVLRFTEHVERQGDALLQHACALGLEGVVSKRASGRYVPGRSRQWIKAKCTQHAELVVGGYTPPSGARAGFGALLLGAFQGERLVYVGKVGTGFSERELASLHKALAARKIRACPFDPCPPGRSFHWVRPELVAEVEFGEWTRDGALRHPTYRGLREDRNAAEILLPETQASVTQSPMQVPVSRPTARRDVVLVAGVTITHPERVLYPEQGLTKRALAEYYRDIADWILPGLIERPLSLLRCPQGRAKQCFFQKHPQQVLSGRLPTIHIEESRGVSPYVYVRQLEDLIRLVQAGTLELHVWGSRVTNVERPDRVVFDLDPGPNVPWAQVLAMAVDLRERLAALDFASFPRTTGGKGLHVVVPVRPRADWDEIKRFAHAVAKLHAQDHPARLTVNMAKAKREGRIFVDYLRNGRGATAIASYSTRAREGAPVAVPVRWDELNPALTSDRYTVDNVRRRLRALVADPWASLDEAARPVDRAMLRRVGADA